jgi:hypothetical protein
MKRENSLGYITERAPGLAEAWRLSWTGQLQSALAAAKRLLGEVARRGDDVTRAGCFLLSGECCLHLGRIDEGLLGICGR